MTAYPKPAKRTPRRRKALPRASRPIQRRVRPKPRSETPRARADQRGDVAFSLLIRARDIFCGLCKRRRSSDCAHVMSRRYRATRWDPQNAIGACRQCHDKYTHRPKAWELLNRIRMGTEAYDALRAMARGRTWRKGKGDYFNPRDVALLGGDPSL